MLKAKPPAAGPAPVGPIGSWEARNERGALGFTFQPDGGGAMNGIPIQWSYHDGALSIAMQGHPVSYRASFTAETMQLSGGDLQQEVTLRRIAGPSAADAHIVGTWRATSGPMIEFRPDGSGVNRRGPFHYTATGGVLLYDDGSALVLMSYHIQGDQLVVETQTESSTFERAAADAHVTHASATASKSRQVFINQAKLSDAEVQQYERQFRVRIVDGSYWYDRVSGAWGVTGGPTMGLLPPGLNLGGPLHADASGGGTGVFVNGRELHPLDVAALQKLTPVQPGRSWVQANGNCGYEGNPTPILNLVQLSNAANSRSGGSYHSRSDITGIGSGGDGHTSSVMGKDFSVIIGDQRGF